MSLHPNERRVLILLAFWLGLMLTLAVALGFIWGNGMATP